MSKRSKGLAQSRIAREKLKAIWRKHKFTDAPPAAVQKLARALCDRLQIPIIRNKKLWYSVIAFDEGFEVEGSQILKPKSVRSFLKSPPSPTKSLKATFYASWEWRTLRMEIIKKHGRKCMCCGATPDHADMAGKTVKIVVDHIKPLHHYWHLRLEKSNLQILCEECNMGKGAWDETDHRPKREPDEWIIEDDIPQAIRDQLKYTH